MEEDIQTQLTKLKETVENMSLKRISQEMIIPGAVKARAIEDAIIKRGLASKRPSSGSISCWAYFSTDTNVLSIWTGGAWKGTTLS